MKNLRLYGEAPYRIVVIHGGPGAPGEMEQVANEIIYGYISHYIIGVSLALPFVLGWDLIIGGPASPVWALAYGLATTVASWFFVYPSMGLGVFGIRLRFRIMMIP